MTDAPASTATAFVGERILAAGPLLDVALAVKAALEQGEAEPLLVFDDAAGRVIDLDLRGDRAAIVARLAAAKDAPPAPPRRRQLPAGLEPAAAKTPANPPPATSATAEPPRGRGRPALGVVAREVTLLPRHWEWLSAQPGGASAALRRLVETARRNDGAGRMRAAREAAYRFMSAMAGNRPGYEEAIRALFAGDAERFEALTAPWPADVSAFAARLAWPGWGDAA